MSDELHHLIDRAADEAPHYEPDLAAVRARGGQLRRRRTALRVVSSVAAVALLATGAAAGLTLRPTAGGAELQVAETPSPAPTKDPSTSTPSPSPTEPNEPSPSDGPSSPAAPSSSAPTQPSVGPSSDAPPAPSTGAPSSTPGGSGGSAGVVKKLFGAYGAVTEMDASVSGATFLLDDGQGPSRTAVMVGTVDGQTQVFGAYWPKAGHEDRAPSCESMDRTNPENKLQFTCRTLDDGTVVASVTAPTFIHYSAKESGPDAYESDRPGEEEYSISVDVISPDGRVVSVSALNATEEKGGMTRPDPALSRDELIKIAQNPAWADLPPLP
ncbi:hypothetical protein ACQCX2_05630 [Propionibacteriaceae bacterium Y1700]|uniref:hypothetical protein n=1 Tax=Microlunatus sp. Y1700 TaxID=3418487 RepID=UPI003DA77B73